MGSKKVGEREGESGGRGQEEKKRETRNGGSGRDRRPQANAYTRHNFCLATLSLSRARALAYSLTRSLARSARALALSVALSTLYSFFSSPLLSASPPLLLPPDDLNFLNFNRSLLLDPWIAADGHSYEKNAIQEWFSSKGPRSPTTVRSILLAAARTHNRTPAYPPARLQ